jgi:hypothetical protein
MNYKIVAENPQSTVVAEYHARVPYRQGVPERGGTGARLYRAA